MSQFKRSIERRMSVEYKTGNKISKPNSNDLKEANKATDTETIPKVPSSHKETLTEKPPRPPKPTVTRRRPVTENQSGHLAVSPEHDVSAVPRLKLDQIKPVSNNSINNSSPNNTTTVANSPDRTNKNGNQREETDNVKNINDNMPRTPTGRPLSLASPFKKPPPRRAPKSPTITNLQQTKVDKLRELSSMSPATIPQLSPRYTVSLTSRQIFNNAFSEDDLSAMQSSPRSIIPGLSSPRSRTSTHIPSSKEIMSSETSGARRQEWVSHHPTKSTRADRGFFSKSVPELLKEDGTPGETLKQSVQSARETSVETTPAVRHTELRNVSDIKKANTTPSKQERNKLFGGIYEKVKSKTKSSKVGSLSQSSTIDLKSRRSNSTIHQHDDDLDEIKPRNYKKIGTMKKSSIFSSLLNSENPPEPKHAPVVTTVVVHTASHQTTPSPSPVYTRVRSSTLPAAQNPLPEVHNTHDQSSPNRNFERRTKIVHEIVETEETYLRELRAFNSVYKKELFDLPDRYTLIKLDQIKSIFGTMQQVLPVNEELLQRLQNRITDWDNSSCIGDIFLTMAPFFKIYKDYGSGYEKALTVYTTLLQISEFVDVITKCDSQVSTRLEGCLILPIQRIPRYKLFLDDLLKFTEKDHPDHQFLSDAYVLIDKITQEIDENIREASQRQRLMEISAKTPQLGSVLLAPHRKLIKEGTVTKVNLSSRKYKK